MEEIMGRIDNSGVLNKLQVNVQEAQRLAEQNKNNLSMTKSRQTLEYMIMLQCDKAGIVQGDPDTMVRELYSGRWISKQTAERYLRILAIGEGAAKGDDSAANASLALQLLSAEIETFAGGSSGSSQTSAASSAASSQIRATGTQTRQTSSQTRQTSSAKSSSQNSPSRTSSQTRQSSSSSARQSSSQAASSSARSSATRSSSARTSSGRTGSSSSRTTARPSTGRNKKRRSRIQPSDILRLLIPIVLIIILIFLIHALTTDNTPVTETTAAAETTEAVTYEEWEPEADTEEWIEAEYEETEPEDENAGSAPLVYRTTDTLNVRQEPSTNSSRIGRLDPGTVVDFIENYDEGWAVINYNGTQAYVSRDYLTESEN